jgi:VWFA-related protein
MVIRKWAWAALVLGVVLPGCSAEPISVAQLENMLGHSQTRPDGEIAARLSELQLTERMSSQRIAHWRAVLPGAKAQRALLAVADRSSFLPLPAVDLPTNPPPDLLEQRRILGLTANYVSKAIPLLPRFYAARTTIYFEDSAGTAPDGIETGSLRAVRIARTTVQYHDGQEILQPGPVKTANTKDADKGLRTWGVFGPVLGLVLVDAAQNKLSWGHWEIGANGPLAVFDYSVPREKSHYEVRYCCVAAAYGMQTNSFHVMSGYHGEIAVDPASGVVTRLTLQAELSKEDPISRADLAVEYGPVELGQNTYICPQRSVSISISRTIRQVQDSTGHSWPAMGPVQMLLNHADFDQYHLFRAETRVLSGEEERTAGLAPDATLPAATGSAEVAVTDEDLTEPPATTLKEPDLAKTGGIKSSNTQIADGEASEITTADATGMPGAVPRPMEPEQFTDQKNDVSFRINARLVDVNVVALDKKGRPVSNLNAEDFEIYDNGVKQNIRSFSRAITNLAVAREVVRSEASEDGTFTNQVAKDAKLGDSEANSIVLLVDGSNLAMRDFALAKQQLLDFLNRVPANQRVALYAMRYHSYQVLEEATSNHPAIAARLKAWIPSAQDRLNARDEEERNRQQIDTVHSPEDMLSVNGNYTMDTGTQTEPLDPKLRELGSQPGPIAMALLTEVSRHLASIPGHKSLVWVTSDNVLADWTKASITIERSSRFIEPVALRTQEALNNAHVSVYPLDASFLEGGAITADIGTRNVELTPTFQRPLAYEKLQEGPESGSGQDMNPYIQNRNITGSGRLLAQMEQDMHPIQGVFREVADATGGRTFGRSNNMLGQLNAVAAEGNATYLLGFTPSEAADGKYHLLTVKVAGRKDITVRYRTGYKYDKEAASLKDRFQEVIWQPVDAGEIGLSTKPIVDAAGRVLRVTVKGTDLELAQHNGTENPIWSGKLDIFLVHRDAEGQHARVTGQTVGLRLKPGTYQHAMNEGLTFDERIESKLAGGSLRVVVIDVNSGRLGSVTVPSTAFQQ